MIVVNEHNKETLHQNKINVLDYYFDKVNMMLWPRFTNIFDHHSESVKKANINNFKLYNQTVAHSSSIRFA